MAHSLCSKILLQIRKYKLISMSIVDDEQIAIDLGLIQIDEMIAELAYIRNYDEEIDEKMIIKINQRQDFLIEVEKEIKAL